MTHEIPEHLRILCELDQFLTDKKSQVHHLLQSKFATIEGMLDERIFYLSNGGYSRVVWNLTTEELVLASDDSFAHKTVAERWDAIEAINLRNQLARHMRSYRDSIGLASPDRKPLR